MRWSHSVHTTMRRCQRQVGFGYIVASGTSTDPVRREAHILKQLQHLPAWQGSVVHSVLQFEFLEDLQAGRPYDALGLTLAAQDLAHRQFAFSAAGHYRRPKQTKSAAGREYCALFEHDRGIEISADQLAAVHTTIARCFDNLGTQTGLLAELAAGYGHLAERSLTFRLDGFPVAAQPDLVFLRGADGQPTVVDWKIGESETSDYSHQLLLYALAVARSGQWPGADIEAIQLFEVNLLKNQIHQHPVTRERLDEAEDFAYRGVSELRTLVGMGRYEEVDLDELDVAGHSTTCRFCSHQPMCHARLEEAGQPSPVDVIQGSLML